MCFRPPTAQKKMEPCPQCQTVRDALAVCPNCGFVPEISCPKCGAMNLITNEKCSQCGYEAPKTPPPLTAPLPPQGALVKGTPPKVPPAPPKVPPAPPKVPPMPPKKPE